MAIRRVSALLALLVILSSVLGTAPAASAAQRSGPSDLHERQTARGTLAPRQLKVALQVGHWKNNELPKELSSLSGHTGAAGGGHTELELNLDMANRVSALLRASGYLVEILPATVPTGYTADAFVALHADGNSSTRTRGFKISTRWRSVVPLLDASLVEMLTEEYRAATGLPEDDNVTRNMRGYYAYASWRPNWRISNFTPGAIVEMGFMTNATDREVMFGQPDRLASGISKGIVRFLKWAYSGSVPRAYGHGIADPSINMAAPAFPQRRGGQASSMQAGNWEILLMGPPTLPVYASPSRAVVVGSLPRGRFYRSTLRSGDFYRVSLPGGGEGWVHRNSVVARM